MRIPIDENVPVQMPERVRRLLPGHDVCHVSEIRWAGKRILPSSPMLRREASKSFSPRDGRQPEDPSETSAIKKSGMHHIRFGHGHKGMAGLGLAMGAVIAAMPLIVRELDTAHGRQLIHIKGLNPGSKQRFDLVDPCPGAAA